MHRYLLILPLCVLLACEQRPAAPPSRVSARDSAQVFAWFEQAYAVQHTNPDSAYALIRAAGALSRRAGFEQGLFNYYNQAMFNRAAFRGDIPLATRLSDTSLTLVQDESRRRFRMLTYFSRAVLYQIQEQNDSAIVWYLRALDNMAYTKDTSRIPIIQNNLAILFHYQQRDDLAVQYQQQSLARALAERDTGAIIAGYTNLYGFEVARKDTATAYTYLQRGLQMAQTKDWRQSVELYKNATDYHLARHQTDSARGYVAHYYALAEQLFAPTYLAQPLLSMARTEWQAGNVPATERHLREARRRLSPDSLPVLERQVFFDTEYQLLRRTNRPMQALVALEGYNAAVRDFNQGEKNRQLIAYDARVKQLQIERERAAQQYALDRKNALIAALVVGCLLLAGLGTLGVLYWRKRKLLESEKLTRLQLATEWQTLRSRMEAQQQERSRISQELHDELGAALTSISLASELLKQQQPTPEVQIIARSSAEMTTRMNEIVWSLNVNNDNVQSLVAYIRKFCSEFLGEAGIQMVFTETIADPQRELKGIIRKNVYQSVKEAVNNVVKHAEASRVELAIQTVENELHILIHDNGKGLPPDPAALWSNGLRNMKKNIETIQGRISWEIINGTQVRIEAPM
jgi:signal transduction histidine kinase